MPAIFDSPQHQQQPQQSQQSPQPQAQVKQDFQYGQAKEKGPDAESVARVNHSLGNRDASAEIAAAQQFSDEDIRVTEEVLFRGWAKKSYPIMGGRHYIEVATSTPIEIDLVDEIVNDTILRAQKDNSLEALSTAVVNNKQKLLTMASYFVGVNGKDICPNVDMQLETIRSGIQAIKQMTMSGELAKLKDTKQAVKDMLSNRADYIGATQNTMVLDAVSACKTQFESMVLELLESKELLPK